MYVNWWGILIVVLIWCVGLTAAHIFPIVWRETERVVIHYDQNGKETRREVTKGGRWMRLTRWPW